MIPVTMGTEPAQPQAPEKRVLVQEHVRDLVASGALRRGSRVPSILELSRSLGVAKNTVIAALDELCGEGLLEARPRQGFFVRSVRRRERARETRLTDLEIDRVAHGMASILVHSGQVHAIDAGNLILEIQQNSDTTYRVYDWGRVGLDGAPRQLHIEQSLRSIDWTDFEPTPLRGAPTSGVIADCPEFRIRRVVLGAGEKTQVRAREQPRLLSVVSGSVRVSDDGNGGTRASFRQALARGDNVLVPYAGAFTFAAEVTTILLLTENFTGAS